MKKLILLLMVVSLAGSAGAASVWIRKTVDGPGNWGDAANWNAASGVPVTAGGVPTSATNATRTATGNAANLAEIWVTDAQTFGNALRHGYDETVQTTDGPLLRIKNGGSLTASGSSISRSYVGYWSKARMDVEAGGSFTTPHRLYIGYKLGSHGTVDVYGTVNVDNQKTFVGFYDEALIPPEQGDGFLNIYPGGVYNAEGFASGRFEIGTDNSIVNLIGNGKLSTAGNDLANANTLIAGGRVAGWGLLGNVSASYDSATNTTSIIAGADPLNRYPALDQTVAPRSVTLSWLNIQSVPPGGPVWVDVWFGTSLVGDGIDPNFPDAGKDFNLVVDAAMGELSVPVSLVTETTEGFFWQINTYVYGDPAHDIYNYGDDPNLTGYPITEGMLMNFHAPNGPSCAGSADLNCNGIAGLDDLLYIAGVWLTDDSVADIALPTDNMVDLTDVSVLTQQWLDVSQEIAYLAFDETEGDIASDSSVNDYVGILIGMDNSDWVGGNAGNALDFDGIDDYVAVDDIFAEIAGRDLTISAWVNAPATNPAPQFMIGINAYNGGNRLLLGTQADTATLTLYESGWHDTTATVIDNTWHHIAFVLDDSANRITVYVDGSEALSFTSTISIAAGDLLSLGQKYTALTPNYFYDGQLDEVKVYDRALSEAEIAALAQ